MTIRKTLKKYHRIRKKKETLPKWKRIINNFNEKHLHWLENFVDTLIPYLVLILLVIILGEYAHEINIFHWAWMDHVAEFFHHQEQIIYVFDKIIIGFFIVDLYFNFFTKAKFMTFVRTSILDIIAVAPLGAIFRVAEVGEAQLFVHVGGEVPKATKLTRAEELTRLARLEKTTAVGRVTARMGRALSRLPRLFRLHRLSDFWKKK